MNRSKLNDRFKNSKKIQFFLSMKNINIAILIDYHKMLFC
jgi:hypothetical protein